MSAPRSADRFQPRQTYTCLICGGTAHRQTSLIAPYGMEDVTKWLLHDHDEDWLDNPHDVVPDDTFGEG